MNKRTKLSPLSDEQQVLYDQILSTFHLYQSDPSQFAYEIFNILSNATEQSQPFHQLPREIKVQILSQTFLQKSVLALVCKEWYSIIKLIRSKVASIRVPWTKLLQIGAAEYVAQYEGAKTLILTETQKHKTSISLPNDITTFETHIKMKSINFMVMEALPQLDTLKIYLDTVQAAKLNREVQKYADFKNIRHLEINYPKLTFGSVSLAFHCWSQQLYSLYINGPENYGPVNNINTTHFSHLESLTIIDSRLCEDLLTHLSSKCLKMLKISHFNYPNSLDTFISSHKDTLKKLVLKLDSLDNTVALLSTGSTIEHLTLSTLFSYADCLGVLDVIMKNCTNLQVLAMKLVLIRSENLEVTDTKERLFTSCPNLQDVYFVSYEGWECSYHQWKRTKTNFEEFTFLHQDIDTINKKFE